MTDGGARETNARPTVDVETSVISYLAADPSGDLVTRGHQRSTRRWWVWRARWDLVVSSAVLREAARGNHETAVKRLELMVEIPAVAITRSSRQLADELLRRGLFPPKARFDAEHIAAAAVNGLDYLVTWNLKHIANPAIRRRVDEICRLCGYEPPVICTPEALLES